MKHITHLLLFLLALFTGAGCTVAITHKVTIAPDGTRTIETSYRSPAFGSKAILKADFERGTIEGARSDQSSITDVISGAYQAGIAVGKAAVKP